MTIFPPPARKRHLTLESLNAPALTPPSHSLSSLFFLFQSSNWFWNLNGCSPISEPQACISFPPFLSAIQLSQLLRFLLFPIHFLWRIFPIRMSRKVSQGSFITNSFWFHSEEDLVTCAQADMKQTHFASQSQLSAPTNQVLYPSCRKQDVLPTWQN